MGMLDFMLNEGGGFGMNSSPAAKVPVLPQTPAAVNDVAAMTRATRVAKYGEATVAAMEKAGSTFGSALTTTPNAAVAPVAPAAEAAPGFMGRLAARVPGFGAVARGVGRWGLAAAPVVGAAGAALDSQENVSNLASSVGMDYNSFGGRVGANALNFLSKTGNVATGGIADVVGHGIGDLAHSIARANSGGSFFEPYAPAATTAAPVVSAVADQSGWNSGQDLPMGTQSTGPGAVPPAAAASAGSIAAFPQPGVRNTNFGMQGGSGESAFKSKWGDPTRGATETEQGYIARRVNDVFPGNTAGAYDTTGGDQPLPLDENGLPPSGPFAQAAARRAMYGPGDSSPIASGTGVFKGATGGAVQVSSRAGDKSTFGPVTAADEAANALHARGVSVYGVGNGPGAVPSHAALAGAGIGAIMNQRQAAQREIRSLAQRKLDVEMTGKEAAAAHSRAQTDEIMARAADAERARAAGASAEEIAAIRSGRPRAGGGVKITPTMKDGQVITTDPTGKSVLRTARPPLREADIAESLKNAPKGTTRAQVIQMFKDREYDTSAFDTRRPGFGANEQMSPALRQLLIKAGRNPDDVIVN
jgi:hypothetical protein